MNVQPSWGFLIIIAILVGLALCAIYTVVLLLTNEKSRAVLKGLLSVPAVLIVVSAGYYMMMVPRQLPQPPTLMDQEDRAGESASSLEVKTAHISNMPSSVSTSQIDVSQSEPKSEVDAEPEPLEPTIEDVAAKDRPAWLDTEPQRVGSVYQSPIVAGPYQTRPECEARLAEVADEAIDQYVVLRHGPEAKGKVHLPLDFVHEQILSKEDTFAEWKDYSVGRMVRLHALMRFGSSVNHRLDEEWRRVVVHRRLGLVGMSCTALLLMLSMAYTYLKVNLATEGVYRGRTKLALLAMILVVVTAGILLTRLIS